MKGSHWIMPSTFPNLQVLLVDAEPLFLWAAAETLGAAGHTVVKASDGAAARRAVAGRSGPFDVILLDHRVCDGRDLALLAELHRTSPTSAIVLVPADNHAVYALEERAAVLGARLLLAKPVDMETFDTTMRAAHWALQRELRVMNGEREVHAPWNIPAVALALGAS
jgi:DNA-binding NtrC family response regulator